MRGAPRVLALLALCGGLQVSLWAAGSQPLREWPVNSDRLPGEVRVWQVDKPDTAAATTADPAVAFPEGRGALVTQVTRSPQARVADIQLNYLAHEDLGRGGEYGVSLWVRASQPATCEAGVILDDPPFSGLGAERSRQIGVTTQWQQAQWTFSATRDIAADEAIRAPYLGLGLVPPGVTVWVAGVTFFEATPPPPPVPLLRSAELLTNPSFADGLTGWRAQAAELTPDQGACRVTRRTERWGTPVQDVRAVLAARGPGCYGFGAAVRPVRGRGEVFAVLHLRDAAGDHWITTPTRPMRDSSATRVGAERLVAWTGELLAADLGVQSGPDDRQDLVVDDVSLCALQNLLQGRPATASDAAAGHPAALGCDASLDTTWQATTTEAWLEVDLGRTVTFNACVLAESGTRVRAYALETWQDGQWRACLQAGEIMGLADALHFPPATANRVRLHITRSDAPAALATFALYTSTVRGTTVRVPAPPVDPSQRGTRTLVGAIRWDGWCGDKSPVGLGLERAMSPERYRYRVPFYAQVRGPEQVEIRCTTQQTMDQEIAFAKEAGIDYWAFCWYPPEDGLSTARKLYLASAHRNDVKWCVIAGTGRLRVEDDLRWLVTQFATPNYQTVLGGRPLVYLFNADRRDALTIKQLREAAAAAGSPTPFVVVMGWGPEVADVAAVGGADALGAYVNPVGNGADFTANMAHDRAKWEALRRTGRQLIPTVTTGWDPRPFLDYPVPWYPGATPTNWVGRATPAQVAEQLRAALDFVRAHPEPTLANSVLVYAWNENAEGGWLIPTLEDMQTGGIPRRLDAVRGVLRPDIAPGSGWSALAQ